MITEKGKIMKKGLGTVIISVTVAAGFSRAEQDLTTNDATSANPQVRQARYLVNLAISGGDSVYLQPGESGLYDHSRARGNQSGWYVMNDGAMAGAVAVTYADPGYASSTYSASPDYFGYKFKWPVTVSNLVYVDYCFSDGGTFSSAPALQVLSSLDGVWTTVASSISPSYQNWFSGGRRVTYTITPVSPVTNVWGVRLYGNTTASSAWDRSGWACVTELRMNGTPHFGLSLDFANNLALSGTPFCSGNAWKTGNGSSINDGNFNNSAEVWNVASPAGEKHVGIVWPAPKRRIAALGVALTFFADGGWFQDTTGNPLRVEYTTDGQNWTPVSGLRKGRYTADYAACAALSWDYKGSWLFMFNPVDGVRGVRLAGLPGGSVAALGGNGYVSVRELEVYSTEFVLPECLTGSYLKPGNTAADNNFGFDVGVSRDTLIAGARFEDGGGTDSGAAYIFTRTNGTWSQQAYLKAGTISMGSQFGYSVDIDGDTAIVGVPLESGANNHAGAAYIFIRTNGVWIQQAFLRASNMGSEDRFGNTVAISGDRAIVGAIFRDVAGSDSGAAYVFARNQGVWSEEACLIPANRASNDCFGCSVDISGDSAVIGACYQDSMASDSGAAYVFTRTGGVWTELAMLKASNAGANDFFGFDVAIDGDTLIVSATGEDSNAIGVGGAQGDNSAADAGAAYVFVRTNGVWTQQAYLKATNTGAGDSFGCRVGVSGDFAVVGAHDEDGSASGVYGADDNLLPGAGAAYAYVRTNGVWIPLAYLKASNPGGGDRMGIGVAIDGTCIAAGADYEDGSATVVDGGYDESVSNAGAVYTFDLLEWAPGLRILSFSLDNPAITFRSLPQRYYTLQRCDDLQAGNWTDVTGQIAIPGTGGRIKLQHESAAPRQFYRIKESHAP